MPQCRDDFTDTPFEACGDDLEQAVAGIMASVLDLDRMGCTDSFYDFAGTSLQAIRVCARIESALGLKALPLWLLSSDIMHEFVEQLRTESEQANA
jgi:Phosphopantetheine attachment site